MNAFVQFRTTIIVLVGTVGGRKLEHVENGRSSIQIMQIGQLLAAVLKDRRTHLPNSVRTQNPESGLSSRMTRATVPSVA